MRIVCEICGNETDVDLNRCPFCNAELELFSPPLEMQHRTVRLKQGMPTVNQALARLDQELEQARLQRCRVLTLIHGYGSSGRGGVIRKEIRARLQFLKYTGKINYVMTGEDFSTKSGSGRNLLRRFPFLREHRDLNRGNRGITLVVV